MQIKMINYFNIKFDYLFKNNSYNKRKNPLKGVLLAKLFMVTTINNIPNYKIII